MFSDSQPPASPAKPAKSAVEGHKENGRFLRGGIAEELARDSDGFSEADKSLLKFHGTYQQEDRDARKLRRKDGLGKHVMFMVRCKIPGGRVTANHYPPPAGLTQTNANSTLPFPRRQAIPVPA